MPQPTQGRIGLLAGWGRFPVSVALALKSDHHQVYCLGIRGHADQVLAEICDDFRLVGVAQLGGHIRYFRRHRVQQATMAGKLFKHKLLYEGHWWHHRPDWQFVRTFLPHFITKSRDRNDDELLGTAVGLFARHGISLVPATDLVPELLVKLGQLSGSRLTASQRKDVEFGWRLAKQMGSLDIGQSVAVKGRAVLAVEAIEGTDSCIRRAGQLCAAGGFAVVKVAKPQQDMRFDVPTIGVGTVESMVAAGAGVLAVEAGKTIIIDQPEVIALATRHGVSIVAIDAEDAVGDECIGRVA